MQSKPHADGRSLTRTENRLEPLTDPLEHQRLPVQLKNLYHLLLYIVFDCINTIVKRMDDSVDIQRTPDNPPQFIQAKEFITQ